MADSFYCTENANICFDENNEFDERCSISLSHRRTRDPNNEFFGSETFLGSSVLESEERIKRMVEKEIEHLPTHDYLKRMLSGDLDLKFRREAVDWIWKAHAHYSFGPLSLCLSMNYLDRFLSVYHLPMDKSWTVQLLSVACMSLAAKMEETEVPLPIDLQVEEPKFVFEAKTIQRMELLVLSRLKWKMQAITPFSFIDYFLSKISVEQQNIPGLYFSKSSQLILSTIKGIDFLEFKPSEIALAVAISISREFQTPDMNKAILSFPYMEKERVMKCIELIRDFSLISNVYGNTLGGGNVGSVPQSPVGVLDAACLSYKTEELLTAGSCGNGNSSSSSSSSSSHDSQDSKRRRQDRPSSNDDDTSPSSPVK